MWPVRLYCQLSRSFLDIGRGRPRSLTIVQSYDIDSLAITNNYETTNCFYLCEKSELLLTMFSAMFSEMVSIFVLSLQLCKYSLADDIFVFS